MSDPAVQALMKSLCFLNSMMQKLLQHVNLSGSECRVDVGCWECTIGCGSMHGGTTVQHQIYHCCKLHFSLWSGGFCSSCWVLLFGHYHSYKSSSKGTTWKDLLPKRTVRELGYKGHLHVENCEVVWWGRERAYELTAACLYNSSVIGAMEKSPMEKKVYTDHPQLQLLFERLITRNLTKVCLQVLESSKPSLCLQSWEERIILFDMGKNSASFQCLVLLKTASTQAALASVLVHGVTRENPVLDQSFIETAPKILRFFLLSNLGLCLICPSYPWPFCHNSQLSLHRW
jgi:hypothetical protein